ncbi:IPT/TIG domain-containing protein, partial [Bacteroides sp. OttesenSCG-928-D19]|nr:IPT/TIG domain-containing protein [Bacteroides sp. OttesenSCG-928-D19]
FTVTVSVQNIPVITDPGVIDSGKDVQLSLNFPCAGTYSIIGDNDPAIAYITPSGMLYTDTRVEKGKPTEHRDEEDEHEGIGGTVTIQFESTNGGCPTTRNITVKPRTKTPKSRWRFNKICPIDEEEATHEDGDEDHIATPWNVGDRTRKYFANHIVWDSLVVVNHEPVYMLVPELDEDDNPILDENGEPKMKQVINEVENVKFLKKITWYKDNNDTKGDELRKGLDEPGEMKSFWQNAPYKPTPTNKYWATVTDDDHCESYPIPVVVEILETPEEVEVDDFVGYLQPEGTAHLDLNEYVIRALGGIDEYQTLYWFDSEEGATLLSNEEDDSGVIDAPTLDPTVVGSYTYWLVLSDNEGCSSLPTEYHVQIVDMPQIAFTSQPVMVCPNGRVNMQATITGGTAPYYFEVMNMNRNEVIYALTEETENDLVHGFRANPLATCAYRIFKFKDAYTDAAAKGPYALPVAYETYFDELTLSVIVSEVSEVVPGTGPTSGGTYTEDPENPTADDGKVTILGSGFMPDGIATVTEVLFGGTPATGIEVIDNNTLKCIPPAHVSGYVTISVENGCTVATLTDGYIYEPLNIIGISPDYGPVTGGTTITIQGTGFMPTETSVVTVSIAGVTATVTSATNGKIVCTTGVSNHSMKGDIVINNGTETREFVRRFTYYPVKFVENGQWDEYHKWETQTNDHILPFPKADIEIHANCLQNVDVDMNTITVAPGKAYTLAAGIKLEAEEFTLKANASFLDYNSITGNMQAKKQNLEHILTKGRNWYVSSPVRVSSAEAAFGKDTEGNDLTTATENWRVQRYNEPSHVWGEIPGNLLTGRGYTAFSANADIRANFSGAYMDGDVNTSFAITRQDDGNAKRGFNLVGNPFPSYWRWTAEAAEAANLYSTIWYRTQVGGVYQFWSYNASGDVAVAPGWEDATPTGSYSMAYVAPMQAFWVRMLLNSESSSGILTFKDNLRSHADHPSNVMTRTGGENLEHRPLLRLTADDGMNIDETVIYADPESQPDFDTYDGDKWFDNRGVEIFTLPVGSTRPLVINGLPAITDGTEIPIGFQADEGGAFCFHAKEILNMDTLHVYLVDKWRNNVEVDLRMYDYNFTSSSVPVTDRFSIVFRSSPITGLPDVIEEEGVGGSTGNDLLAYSGNNGEVGVLLYLKNREGSNETVSVFDITGRKLAEESVVVGQRTILKNKFAEGAYILRAGKCAAKVLVSF